MEAEAAIGDRRRILVIEDDPVVRFNLVSYLEDSGFAVSEEADGASGIALARRERPDLVLCDLRVPGADGIEILRTLHAEQPEVPLVVVSGTGILHDAVEALREGAWDFITKPIQDMGVLEHAILGAFEKAQLVRDNRRFHSELERANHQLRDNLGQFEQDAAAGRQIQLQLMPPPESKIDAYRFQHYLRPSLYLSGDFVDYFVLDRRHVGFYLADVSGHGVSSAFVTVLLKSFIQRHRELLCNENHEIILDPGKMLGELNAYMLGQQLDKYLTIFYGVIDLDVNRLVYANGGHLPSALLFDGTTGHFLDGRGPPVGLFRDSTYGTASVELPQAHLLVLCSDGLLDALPDPSLAAKRSRLLRAVDQRGLTAEDVLEALALTPSTVYPDDVTLLIAEREV
jgi:sigma-B regulation protein RsbU (phosphoserine phosphatase)